MYSSFGFLDFHQPPIPSTCKHATIWQLAILEMEKNLTYELNQSKETLELNEKFLKIYKTWKNYEKHHGFIHPKASISTSFLSQNKDWFLS